MCSGRIFLRCWIAYIKFGCGNSAAKKPDVILVSRDGKLGEQWLSFWKQWSFVNAVENNQLFTANPDYLVRHTPRIVHGIEQVCSALQPHI